MPVEHLGSYLRDFDRLLDDHGFDGLPYGHFGDGCVHVRIDFPLTEQGGASGYKVFVEEAAQLVARYGGSLSGEHGDGRARSELLPAMYSAAALEIFGQVKAAFDPKNLLNPGVLVDPRPVDADLRAVALWWSASTTSAEAVHRCSGVGKCLADTTGGLGVMCPSYQATREEKDSTRGRARVLQEMINGERGAARLEVAGGAPSTGSLPVMQGMRAGLPDRESTWPRTSRRCLITPIAARSGRAATTRSAGCRAGAG